ncbi:hypothetical protein CWE13_02880 [Aliidiomarina shirensis]|uniref:Uncharacterized protein n=1 Tax=Aliidiomarina shirensis TaxID=1048642 RepID=A0A432WY08_9GAMM|nr:hypothetical protein CWE13_02880 [Aliidiomarina shirensis]
MIDNFAVIFVILLCSVLLWFFLCIRLFKILETRHPEKYESMGKPSLFLNNSISNNITFMKFLFKREWRGLNDPNLALLSNFMLVFFVVYMAVFLTLFVSIQVRYVL